MEEPEGLENSLADEEQLTPNDNPICCSSCGIEIIPAQAAIKTKKRVTFCMKYIYLDLSDAKSWKRIRHDGILLVR